MKASTKAVRAGIGRDVSFGAVVPPIYLATSYVFPEFGEKPDYDYSRSNNPTRDLLGEAIAELEGGDKAVVTSSGMSAVMVVLQLLAPDDLLVAPHDCYGGTFRLFEALARRGAFRRRFVDQTNAAELAGAIAMKPRLLWVETPSNPLLRVVDIEHVCTAAKEVGSLVLVDNTFLSPALQRPLALGADLVLHSSTKYLNGHGDVVAGCLLARNAELGDQLRWWANAIGATGSAFDSYLVMRGLRTLHVRMERHEKNARAVVETLRAHHAVRDVYHPSIPEHPGHAAARRQQSGFGAIVSFDMHGSSEAVRAFAQSVRLFTMAESLGGVESLVSHSATMTHACMTAEARARAGISDSLFRLSVGLEDARDLAQDLVGALDAAARASQSSSSASVPRAHEQM